jgi:hypothetical protein
MKTPEDGEIGIDGKMKICCAPSCHVPGTAPESEGPKAKERNSGYIMDRTSEEIQVALAGSGGLFVEKSRNESQAV